MALTIFTRALSVIGTAVLLAGCQVAPSDVAALPSFELEGSQSRQYKGVAELADISSAIVIVTPTEEETSRPIPAVPGVEEEPAPVPYIRVSVDKVLSGRLEASKIDLVSPGIDEKTGKQALVSGGSYLLFITPAMIDVGKPLGGYVVSGGANGVFVQLDPKEPNNFYSAFHKENPTLPEIIKVGSDSIPEISHTEAELIKVGPQ